MDSIKNKVENAVGKKEDKAATPGNSVEQGADNAANSGKFFAVLLIVVSYPSHATAEIDNIANQAGVPQSADNSINKAVDGKINDEIPGGN